MNKRLSLVTLGLSLSSIVILNWSYDNFTT